MAKRFLYLYNLLCSTPFKDGPTKLMAPKTPIALLISIRVTSEPFINDPESLPNDCVGALHVTQFSPI